MTAPLQGMVGRRLLPLAIALMAEEPVLLLQGPRTVGKSHLLAAIAKVHGATVLDLDDLATRRAAAADPGFIVRGESPVLLDEYQHVPELLDAIKAELNTDLRPGRFVLAGSTRYDALPIAAQSLTGRLHRVEVLPLSQGELSGTPDRFLDRLLTDQSALVTGPSPTTRDEYIKRIVRGGLPLALARESDVGRGRWFDGYIDLTLGRDVPEIKAQLRKRSELPKYLATLASQSAQLLSVRAASEVAGFDKRTGESYLTLLEAVFLMRRLPAWGSTLRKRTVGQPKIHVVDSGVAAHLLGLTASRLARKHPTALTMLGHLLETFVIGELRKQASWRDDIDTIGHWRTHDGYEVDLVIERSDGTIAGIEVKAGSIVRDKDLEGLRKLRGLVGDRFVAGAVVYLGQRSYTVERTLMVLPVDRLWTA